MQTLFSFVAYDHVLWNRFHNCIQKGKALPSYRMHLTSYLQLQVWKFPFLLNESVLAQMSQMDS